MCRSYSTAPEILAYFKKLAEKYNLLKYVRLSHRIVGAFWQEETQEWLVKIQRGDNPDDVFEDRCNILVNASGVLKYAPIEVSWDMLLT
jgi:cation diffusion facilitator CzcD-associated flavoprotein CzcO